MNSVDRHDSAIPMAHYDCKDDASNLCGTVCHKLTGRKTSFKRTLQEVRIELHSKCNRMQVELPYTLKKKKKKVNINSLSCLLTWSNIFLNWTDIKEKTVCLDFLENSPFTRASF